MNRRDFGRLGLAASLSLACGEAAPGFAAEAVGHVHPLPPSSVLPAGLVFVSGKSVATKAQWAARRREILRTATEQMYGVSPRSPRFRAEMQEERGVAFSGLAHRRQVRLHFGGQSRHPGANLLLYTPVGTQSAPVIVGLNFWGNHTLSDDPEVLLPDSWVESGKNPFAHLSCVVDHRATAACRGIDAHRWPVERLLREGYAVCTMYRGDIDSDNGDDNPFNLRLAYPELQGRGDNFSAVGAWAWALQRMLDYVEKERLVDARRAAVFGWSRLGKAAVWAGASDSRFAVVLSQESGSGGAKLFRRGVGESIRHLNTAFPYWFCKNFQAYTDMDKELPFDQHLILASIAPRPLFVASAEGDHGSDPEGEFASAALASDVWSFLGYEGIPAKTMPAVEHPLMGRVGYQIRTGGHDVTSYDWEQYLIFLKRYL